MSLGPSVHSSCSQVTSEAIAQSIWERMSEFFPDTELINEVCKCAASAD